MLTAEAAALVAMTVGVTWVAHRLGRSVSWRARLRHPLTNETYVPQGFGGQPRTAHVMAVTLGVLGLGVLTAMAAFRAGRKET